MARQLKSRGTGKGSSSKGQAGLAADAPCLMPPSSRAQTMWLLKHTSKALWNRSLWLKIENMIETMKENQCLRTELRPRGSSRALTAALKPPRTQVPVRDEAPSTRATSRPQVSLNRRLDHLTPRRTVFRTAPHRKYRVRSPPRGNIDGTEPL